MSFEEWVRSRQSREEKQSNEWSQKRKEWEHLERSKYITMYRREAATKGWRNQENQMWGSWKLIGEETLVKCNGLKRELA